jgi:hypothetical protein
LCSRLAFVLAFQRVPLADAVCGGRRANLAFEASTCVQVKVRAVYRPGPNAYADSSEGSGSAGNGLRGHMTVCVIASGALPSHGGGAPSPVVPPAPRTVLLLTPITSTHAGVARGAAYPIDVGHHSPPLPRHINRQRRLHPGRHRGHSMQRVLPASQGRLQRQRIRSERR